MCLYLSVILLAAWCLTPFRGGDAARLETCDCGVIWAPGVGPPSSAGFNTAIVALNLDSNPGVSIVPVDAVQDLQLTCYERLDCDGVVHATTGTTGTGGRGFMFQYKAGGGLYSASLNIPLDTLIETRTGAGPARVYLIDRSSLYDCLSTTTLDAFYYYFESGARASIEATACPWPSASDGTCCWYDNGDAGATGCVDFPDPVDTPENRQTASALDGWSEAATAHWSSIGHTIRRFNPNAGCRLQPTLWTEASYCKASPDGCYRPRQSDQCEPDDAIPCSGNGYCVEAPFNSSKPYTCSCKHFTGTDSGCSCPVFGGIEKFRGIACANDVTQDCRWTGNPSQACNGHNDRCVPLYDIQSLECEGPSHGYPYPDFKSKCDCDALPAINTMGQYCEVDRCDPANHCQVRDGASICVHTGPGALDFACVCGSNSVGSTCQYSADTCKCANPPCTNSDTKCTSGRGTCVAPFLSGSYANKTLHPNYNDTHAWCDCQLDRAYGSRCQFLRCDSGYVTPGQGRCDPQTGELIACYAPYRTSSQAASTCSSISKTCSSSYRLCDVDRCAETGGMVIGNPPASCDCGLRVAGSAIGLSGDITCYPRCPPSPDAPECNGFGSCSHTGNSTSRYAQCICDQSHYVGVPYPDTLFDPYVPPLGQTLKTCEDFCVHGTLNPNWDANTCANYATTSPSGSCACSCSNTGYDTRTVNAVQHLRCDYKICQNNGTWNTLAHACDCQGPYSSLSECIVNTCDNALTAQTVEGTVVGGLTCACKQPFVASSGANLDCASDRCGLHGDPNLVNSTVTGPASMCICDSGYTSAACGDATGATCVFCAVLQGISTVSSTAAAAVHSSSSSSSSTGSSPHSSSSASSTGLVHHSSTLSSTAAAVHHSSSSSSTGTGLHNITVSSNTSSSSSSSSTGDAVAAKASALSTTAIVGISVGAAAGVALAGVAIWQIVKAARLAQIGAKSITSVRQQRYSYPDETAHLAEDEAALAGGDLIDSSSEIMRSDDAW